MMNKVLRFMIYFFVFIFAYLCMAYLWAYQTSEIAIEQYTAKNIEGLSLTKDQVSMLLKIEDPSFWTNSGIDIFHDGQGKTTITQSIVPILLYRADVNGWRAGLQSVYNALWPTFKKIDLGRDVMALAVSKKIPKERILKVYVEQAYLGFVDSEYIVGLSNAAQKYYKKRLKELKVEDFAGLVGMLKSPDYFNPIKNKEAFEQRRTLILKVIEGSCVPEGLFDTSYLGCL